MRLVLTLSLLSACSDYNLEGKEEAAGTADSTAPDDTGETTRDSRDGPGDDTSGEREDEGSMALNECTTEETTVGTFDPAVEWHWEHWSANANYAQVAVTPIVTHLTDDNGDGKYDASDIPTVIIEAMTLSPTNGYGGIMVALRGTDGAELWVYNRNDEIAAATAPAAADIDGDGDIEIVAGLTNGKLVLIDHLGNRLGETSSAVPTGGTTTPLPSIADLDGDGSPEIVAGRAVYDSDLSVRWVKNTGGEGVNFWVAISAVADLDGDTHPDIVAGNTAYDRNGTILWTAAAVPDGFPAVADFDGDGDPEVVVVSGGAVYLLDGGTGRKVWGPVAVDGYGGPPTVADVDGDGQPEIGVAGQSYFWCLETDGSVKWKDARQDLTSSATGSSVFDFEGDGSAELAYADELRLRIYDGATGTIRYEIANPNGTAFENPVIVDVDLDGNAEVLIVGSTFVGPGATGVRAIGDLNDSWVPTRSVWNQHSYHIGNIEEDGSVPRVEVDSWSTHNTYRLNALNAGGSTSVSLPDLVLMDIDTDRGGCPRTLGVDVQVGNQGIIPIAAGVPVSLYSGLRPEAANLLGTATTTTALGSLESEWLHFDVASADLGTATVLSAIADDQGLAVGLNSECSEDNNTRDEEPLFCE